MLRVSAGSVTSGTPSDAYEVVVDGRAELTLVLLDVVSAEPARADLSAVALRMVLAAVKARAPMYEIVASLRTFSAAEHKTSVGVSLMRFSQPEARVEILNAGMPAIACVLPDGRLTLHAALSPAIGRRFGDVHPYELSPLIWGSSWLSLSDGLTAGKQDAADVSAWLLEHDLPRRAAELAGQKPVLLAALARKLAPVGASAFGDATLLVVNADPTRRFRSGIQP
jgi:hypothetical protein